MASLPANVALGNIGDGSNIVASDHRNNYSSIQVYINALNALLGAGAAGQLLSGNGTTLTWTYPPGYEAAYQPYTSDQTTTSTSAVDLFTFSAATFDAAKYYFEIAIPNLRSSATNNSIQFLLLEGAGQVGETVQFDTSPTASLGVSTFYRMPFTPSAGPHTYKVQWLTVFAGTATIKSTAVGDATFRIVKA